MALLARWVEKPLNELSIADYLSAVDHGISRQQALNDLSACKEIEPTGRGRGALWQRKK